MNFMFRAKTALFFLTFFLLSFNLASAQSVAATLSGTVTDENSASVPGAVVTLTNDVVGFAEIYTTGEDGTFNFSTLEPGNYTVIVKRDGFVAVQINNIVLGAGDKRALAIQLKIGVVGGCDLYPDPKLVDHSTIAGITITPNNRSLLFDLPLNGRSFSNLSLLAPGATITSSNAATDLGQFSNNGLRASTNLYSVDGVDANLGISSMTGGATNMALSGAYPGTTVFGGTNNLATFDSIEEFKIQTVGYPAESGRQMGAQVSINTRSGTNQFRGTLYEYFRNDALDARNYFNRKPGPQAPLKHHQFGGTIGGPVYLPNLLPTDSADEPGKPRRSGIYNGRDRTFFFAAYEGVRLRQPISGTEVVPSLQLRGVAAPEFQPLLNAFPLPNGAMLNPNAALHHYSVSNSGDADTFGIRLDHRVNDKHGVFGRYSDSRSELAGGTFNETNLRIETQTFTLGSVSLLTSRMSNEFRFSYGKQIATQTLSHNPIDGAVALDPNLLTNGFLGSGLFRFAFSGLNASLGVGPLVDNTQRQFFVSDKATYSTGSHILKVGFNFRRLAPRYAPQDQQAALVASESHAINGVVTSLGIAALQPVRPRFSNYSAFAQDTWKVDDRLTLDLGLRWDINPAPTEPDDALPPVVTGIVGTDVSNATLAPFGTKFYETDYSGFAPRIGAAYQLNATHRWETVVRGGFGLFYDLGSGTASNGWPYGASILRLNVLFPISAANAARPTPFPVTALPTTATVFATDPELKLPYALHWNAGVEQRLSGSHTVSLAYVGTAGRRLLVTQILNQPTIGVRSNPNFASIVYSSNGSESDYHSLQGQYRVLLGNRLTGLASYTWSHAIDTASSDIQPGILERGNADFDVRHNFSAALQYDLPSMNAGRAVKYLTKNWYVASIVHMQSGRPIDITAGGVVIDTVLVTRRPDLVSGVDLYINDPAVPGGRRFNAAAFTLPIPGRQGSFGRNVFRELPIRQVDIGVGRHFNFTEQLRLTLKGEIFNLLNHPMFGGYGTDILSPPTFGIPSQTLNASLGGLSPIYQLGGARAMQLAAKLSF